MAVENKVEPSLNDRLDTAGFGFLCVHGDITAAYIRGSQLFWESKCLGSKGKGSENLELVAINALQAAGIQYRLTFWERITDRIGPPA